MIKHMDIGIQDHMIFPQVAVPIHLLCTRKPSVGFFQGKHTLGMRWVGLEIRQVAHSFTRQFHNIHRAIKRIALQPVLRPRRRTEIVDTILRNSVSEEGLVQNLELPFYENSRAQLYK